MVTWEARAQFKPARPDTRDVSLTDGENMMKAQSPHCRSVFAGTLEIHKLLSAYFGTANPADRVSGAGVA